MTGMLSLSLRSELDLVTPCQRNEAAGSISIRLYLGSGRRSVDRIPDKLSMRPKGVLDQKASQHYSLDSLTELTQPLPRYYEYSGILNAETSEALAFLNYYKLFREEFVGTVKSGLKNELAAVRRDPENGRGPLILESHVRVLE